MLKICLGPRWCVPYIVTYTIHDTKKCLANIFLCCDQLPVGVLNDPTFLSTSGSALTLDRRGLTGIVINIGG